MKRSQRSITHATLQTLPGLDGVKRKLNTIENTTDYSDYQLYVTDEDLDFSFGLCKTQKVGW